MQGSSVVHLPVQDMWVQFLGQEHPLEKEMAIHSSILAWEIPWTEEPGWATVHGVAKRVEHDLVTKQQRWRCRLREQTVDTMREGEDGANGERSLKTYTLTHVN